MANLNYAHGDINNILNLANGYVAAPFNSATSYKVGDYCSRSGKVYRCKTAGAAAWNASRWTEVVLADELSTRDVYNSIVSGASVQVSSSADNFTQIQTMNLDAGVWLIFAGASMQQNTTGFRQIGLTNAPTISADRLSPMAVPTSGGTVMSTTRVFLLSTAGTIYLWARQNSGSTLSMWPFMQAVRLR